MNPCRLIAAFLTLMLGACSTLPEFVNERQPGDAILQGYAGTMGDAVSGESMILLKEIDGHKKKVSQKPPIYLRPGKHELGVEIGGIYVMFQRSASGFLELEFERDRTYSLKCRSVDSNFVIDFVDETDPKTPKVIKTTKLMAKLPTIVPIPIPVK